MGSPQAIRARSHHVAHCEAIVVDCDIDVIDRGQFPGAPGARPGGMAAMTSSPPCGCWPPSQASG